MAHGMYYRSGSCHTSVWRRTPLAGASVAQTLVRLGVGYFGLRTRDSLRYGIADAFALAGQQVVSAS